MSVIAYFDHASTSPLRPEARDAMRPYLDGRFGNPSGSHSIAREALRALDAAREQVAAALGCSAADIVFTSGGTEADNLAVRGPVLRGGGRPVCSAVEHPAVIEPVRALGGVVVPVDSDGILQLETLSSSLEPSTAAGGDDAPAAPAASSVSVVSVMAVNNETGAIQPLGSVAELVRQRAPEALVHVDAVQAPGVLDLSPITELADLVGISGHKFGGPPGSGALVVKSRARPMLSPVLLGGPQERELRAGTQNLPAIVGMAAALEATCALREESTLRLAELGDELEAGLCDVDGVVPALRAGTPRSPAIRNVRVEGVEAEELLIALDQLGVCASAGSACASGALEPSHVLMAMGRPSSAARQHVRFSLGWSTTTADVRAAIEAFGQAVGRIRG